MANSTNSNSNTPSTLACTLTDHDRSTLPSHLPPCEPPHPHPLPTYWSDKFTSPFQHHNAEVTTLPSKAEVVIVGSGMTGLWALLGVVEGVLERLRRPTGARSRIRRSEVEVGSSSSTTNRSTYKVIVLEARDFASGATTRNGGHLTGLPLLHFSDWRKLVGVQDAKRMVRLEASSIELIKGLCKREGWGEEVDLVEGGNVHLFDTVEEMESVRNSLDEARRCGLEVGSEYKWLTAEEVHELYGASPTHLVGAVRIPGNTLYPLKFLTKLYQHCLDRIKEEGAEEEVEVELFTGCCVERVEEGRGEGDVGVGVGKAGGGRWRVLTKGKGVVQYDYVLHCTNAYASYVVPSLAQGPLRIVPTRGQVVSVLPTDQEHGASTSIWPRWSNSFSSPQGGEEYYFQRPYPDSDQRGTQQPRSIILGGSRSAASETGFEYGLSDDSRVNEKVGIRLRAYLGEQFPELFGEVEVRSASMSTSKRTTTAQGAKLRFPHEWTGIMGFTQTNQPIVGPLYARSVVDGEVRLLKGQYISAGYSGHGMPRAPGCGKWIAERVMREMDEEDTVHGMGEVEEGWELVGADAEKEESGGSGGHEGTWAAIVPNSWKLTEQRWRDHFKEMDDAMQRCGLEGRGLRGGQSRWCCVQ
ncbi:BZ3500_MvSof-1268-A1-R1_Chr3-1g06079 [Microbotryum saponariae]|uniref:BZ3500_MvSof-1268-A1-R1_Chr3-1g06079 protein n=1 Tax=Microbotryum saponariae TaxID=289078 RepID=A0A2X0M485_9BASI|nr:BZ3500_MvSof-1268-A1-R1_Chr3-1g06079 [Microbotryum saponariae]SDA03925.1 BZ3501_MvSof-1269-A2-R1_Chr3-2g05764 [Microbotryum saponariae]